MRQTDYGTVSCWYERDLLAKIDHELKQQTNHQANQQNNKPRCKANGKA